MPNEATALDNAFQTALQIPAHPGDRQTLAAAARHEVSGLAEALEAAGVTVHVFEDHDETRPDSVFPNNWLSTHAGGRIGIAAATSWTS